MEEEQNSTLNIIREADIWNLTACHDLNFDPKFKPIHTYTPKMLGNRLDKCGKDTCKMKKATPKLWDRS